MLPSQYVEDIFLQFYDLAAIDQIVLQPQDHTACSSFYSAIIQGKELTQNQANFILKLLSKYQSSLKKSSLDYTDALQNPQWRTSFRILDLSKKIFVEKDSMGTVQVCIKFPYQLKKEFDEEFEDQRSPVNKSIWDPERKLRQVSVYDANLIQLYEFALKHNFEIDDTFMIALAEVEEIWQNQEEVLPFSSIVANWVVLGNSSAETDEWFKTHSSGLIDNDLLLAKSMGYQYSGKPHTMIEKIAASDSNSFWIKNNTEFLNLCSSVTGRVCIILDRTSNTLDWLTQFIDDADAAGIDRDEIKVCFREPKEQDTGINEWIKTNGVGGKVETGRILIFEFKPAKWLFKEKESVKLLVSNNLYPPTNQLTKDWVSGHPCVIYLGDIKPSEQRGQNIVEL
jgi:hypothetical protein